MTMDLYKKLLEKFWAGEATELEKWQLYKLITELEKQTLVSQKQAPSDVDEEETLGSGDAQRILEALHIAIDNTPSRRISSSRGRIVRIFRSASAVAAILITIFLVSKWAFHPSADKPSEKRIAVLEKTIANHFSHILTVTLEDSSQVNLYPESSIHYAGAFNAENQRIVRMQGKAIFSVQHNADKPFRVIAGNIVTTDIGTKFCIDALDTNFIKVTLTEGSVRVDARPASGMTLSRIMQHPGEELGIDLVNREIRTSGTFGNTLSKTDHGTSVKRARAIKPELNFNRTALAEVFTRLAQREQVHIHFENADVEGLTFTGAVEPKDPLELSLNIICSLNGLSYTKTGPDIVITKSK